MYGRQMGELSVYLREQGSTSLYPLYEKKGEVGNDWTLALVDVVSNKPYQVRERFERL